MHSNHKIPFLVFQSTFFFTEIDFRMVERSLPQIAISRRFDFDPVNKRLFDYLICLFFQWHFLSCQMMCRNIYELSLFLQYYEIKTSTRVDNLIKLLFVGFLSIQEFQMGFGSNFKNAQKSAEFPTNTNCLGPFCVHRVIIHSIFFGPTINKIAHIDHGPLPSTIQAINTGGFSTGNLYAHSIEEAGWSSKLVFIFIILIIAILRWVFIFIMLLWIINLVVCHTKSH